jgi:hypothetical protein
MSSVTEGQQILDSYFTIQKDDITPVIISRLPQKEIVLQTLNFLSQVSQQTISIDVTLTEAIVIKFLDMDITRFCYIFPDNTVGYGQ